MAIIDVIKYEGSKDVLVFKHPIEDFNKKAQLIVHEKQEAIVFMEGVAGKAYGPGRYELTSKNIPGLKHIVSLFSGGELANHCEVFFLNKGLLANIHWITSPMKIQDHTLQAYYPFQAQGFFSVKISDYKALFDIASTSVECTVEDLQNYFLLIISAISKEVVSTAMVQRGLSYGEVNSFLSQFSTIIKELVEPDFNKIGLALERFVVEGINDSGNDLLTEQNEVLVERGRQAILGYDYVTRRTLDVAEAQANNQGGSGVAASAVSGAMFGMGVGQVYNGVVANAVNRVFNNNGVPGSMQHVDPNAGIVKPHELDDLNIKTCKHCGAKIEGNWKYCMNCGKSLSDEYKCPVCGEKITKGAHYCNNCGTEIV